MFNTLRQCTEGIKPNLVVTRLQCEISSIYNCKFTVYLHPSRFILYSALIARLSLNSL